VPSTFTGLVLFVVLLAPGFAYAAARDRRFPERTSSAFRESTRVVLASVAFDAISLTIFALMRSFSPSLTPDIGRLVRDGGGYLRMHYASVTAWSCALLALAAIVAVATATVAPRPDGTLHVESSWWLLFHTYPRVNGATEIRVGCELVDGSYVAGKLQHFAFQAEETGDRELALGQPLDYRPDTGDVSSRHLESQQLVTISARQIKFMTVAYLVPPDSAMLDITEITGEADE
jgi:hypothetical protein